MLPGVGFSTSGGHFPASIQRPGDPTQVPGRPGAGAPLVVIAERWGGGEWWRSPARPRGSTNAFARPTPTSPACIIDEL